MNMCQVHFEQCVLLNRWITQLNYLLPVGMYVPELEVYSLHCIEILDECVGYSMQAT